MVFHSGSPLKLKLRRHAIIPRLQEHPGSQSAISGWHWRLFPGSAGEVLARRTLAYPGAETCFLSGTQDMLKLQDISFNENWRKIKKEKCLYNRVRASDMSSNGPTIILTVRSLCAFWKKEAATKYSCLY